MYKMILNDYRSHFKSSLKKMWNNSGIYYVIFMTIFLMPDEDERSLFYLGLYIPCLTVYILSRMYGGYLNKTFFLCPMDAEGRRQYAIESFRLRMIIPTIMFIIGNVLLLIFKEFDLTIFLLRFWTFGCIAVSVNVYCQPKCFANNNEKVSPFIGNYDTVNIWSTLVNVAAGICCATTCFSVFEMSTEGKVMTSLFLGLQLIVTIIKVKRFYWQSITVMDFYK